MINIASWLEIFSGRLEANFPGRIWFMGLQESYARGELMNWETSDLFQFCYDTVPIRGNLDEVLALVSDNAVRRAVKIGACNIYHACIHNFHHVNCSSWQRG